ncbi:hypothetical protein [Pelomonas sp. Root1444]|uniref:hypothetical protein n=1 Tax=Pelomonas sp. Root1444 TaxID=1736464 RepID=UPI000A5419D9|nr:hypothetical protein [Pelomonas sp. Root1444]
MNSLPRWIAFPPSAAVLVLVTSAHAFTDSNAELKEAKADRSARVVVAAQATVPVRTAWVPPSPKSLDGFKPVLPPDRVAAPSGAPLLAKADAPAPAKR